MAQVACSDTTPEHHRVDEIAEKVLDILFFRQISDRFEGIAEAYDETFQWIYQDPILSDKPWDNFRAWLEEKSGCYWISGKAGSGKSTLMKYLHRDPKTRESLKVWGGNEVVIAAYFFYSLGTTLQKTHEGLLRSLLSEILSQRKHLISTCFPELYRAINKGESVERSEPTFNELRKALSILFIAEPHMRLCLLLDGVDEYEGDFTELLGIVSLMTSSPNRKVVLSSRPTATCMAAFSRHESLRLQDLTQGDIRLYVEKHLMSHPHLQDMTEDEDRASWSITEQIIERASGVFLWVRLVVKSLLQGLDHYDSISDMQRRLNELPSDLKKLYQHMIEQMEPLYRREGSKFLQIVLRSQDVQHEIPLNLRQFTFAADESLTLPRHLPLSRLTYDARQPTVLAGRLRSRCCGLVEIETFLEQDNKRVVRPHSKVTFLHKTVSEFLREDEIWSSLLALTDMTPFDVDVSLLYSCIQCIRSDECFTDMTGFRPFDIIQMVYHIMKYANSAKMLSRVTLIPMLQKLDALLSQDCMDDVRKHMEKWTMFNQDGQSPFCVVMEPRTSTWFVSFIVFAGSPFYLKSRLEGYSLSLTAEQQTSLLAQMVLARLYSARPESCDNALEELMRHPQANPNTKFALKIGRKPWLAHSLITKSYLEAIDDELRQSWYTSWTLILLYLDRLTVGTRTSASEILSRSSVSGDRIPNVKEKIKEIVKQHSLLRHFIEHSLSTSFLDLIENLLEQGANVDEMYQVQGSSSGINVTRSALTTMLRLRERLREAYSEQRGYAEPIITVSRENFEGALDRILTTMKRAGAEERGSDTFYATGPESDSSKPSRQESQSTVLDIPAPPYALDIGPDAHYTG